MKHIPVLLDEVIKHLNLKNGNTIIDATFGQGGHAQKISELISKKGKIIAFERNQDNYLAGKTHFPNITLINKSYIKMKNVLHSLDINKVDGILFDLGVCSEQFNNAKYGFSFMKPGPLDMRFDMEQNLTAYDIINTYPEKTLLNILYKYGEEHHAKKIVKLICTKRQIKKISTTLELKDIIEKALPYKKKNPATKTFQAIRIAVNNEFQHLELGLAETLDLLNKGGRVAVISFHSLEDRIVKNFFLKHSRTCICPKGLPICNCRHKPALKIITRKPITPCTKELEENKKSRSAKLRIAEKT